MASAETIPLERLLTPISDENGVGENLRENTAADSSYHHIKDARKAARAAERNTLFDNDNSEASGHWRKIAEMAPDVLATQSKDLDIACWLTEALIRQHGFQGLRDGFKLISGLIDHFWDDIYPLPDEDGLETRTATLTGLNGEGSEGVLISPIRNVEITQSSDPGPFSYWKYQQVLDVEKIIDEESRAEKSAKLGFNIDDVERSVSDSSEQYYIDICDDLDESIATYRQIATRLDELCGSAESPPTNNIISALESTLGAIKHLAKYKLPEPESEIIDEQNNTTEETVTADNQSIQQSGPVKNREDAFKKLMEISDFFRRTEPHSPIPYILERAVKWGDMPLETLIRELIPDSSARDYYASLTGIRNEED